MSIKAHLIVNPASGNGRGGREFDRLAPLLREVVGEFECAFTRGRGDAVALARDLVRGGARLVVGVGGDGTASEVVDGLVGAPPHDAVFGFIASGTGADLGRTLRWPRDAEDAVRLLARGGVRTIDVGRVTYTGHDGGRASRHFVNVADCGIPGRTVEIVEGMGKALGGPMTFKLGAARALLGWRDPVVRWRADGGEWREERVTAICVCNGRFFGGGMMVAPGAAIDDGLFDVTVWSGLGLSDFVLRKRMLYDGRHVQLRNTRTLRARVVEVEPGRDGEPVLLDVDGEQPGRLPARFEIVPGALRVRADPVP